MARLIDIARASDLPGHLVVATGDLLSVKAAGGLVRSGVETLDVLGSFRTAIVASDGTVISPDGPPTTVLFLIRRPGVAVVELIEGEPWRSTERRVIELRIMDAS